MKRRTIALGLAGTLALGSLGLGLAGCSGTGASHTDSNANAVQVSASFYPLAWLAEQIGGKHVNVTSVTPSGVEPHDYELSPKEVAELAKADFLVYVEGFQTSLDEAARELAAEKKLELSSQLDLLPREETGAVGHHHHHGEGEAEHGEHEHAEHAEHDHEHAEAHAKEVSTFEDGEVKDRELSDWDGEWQSAYPYVLDGSLDKGFEEKAKDGKKSADEYKEYYKTGYETDLKAIKIDGKSMTISYEYTDGRKAEAVYKPAGYHIQDWSSGTRGVLYRFEATEKKDGAPTYIEFNDHIIEPCKAEHFHFRMSDTSFDDIKDPEKYWPTFWPASMDGKAILEAFLGHGHSSHSDEDLDPHFWLDPARMATAAKAIEAKLESVDAANAKEYKANLDAVVGKLEGLQKKFETGLASCERKEAVVNHTAFGYLLGKYGIRQIAVSGIDPEAEPAPAAVAEVKKIIENSGATTLYTEELASTKVIDTIAKETGAQTLMLSPLEAQTDEGDYISRMEANLSNLQKGLGCAVK